MAARELKAPYWIKKNEREAVAIGLQKALDKWQLCAIQYYKAKPEADWIPATRGIRLKTSLYNELVNGTVKLKDRLDEIGDHYSIRKNNQEDFRILIRNVVGQFYIVFCIYLREVSKGGEEKWVSLGEEVAIPTTKYSELMDVIKKMGSGLDFIRKADSANREIRTRPAGRKQFYVDERGFLVSKTQWDEMHEVKT